ncbi:hypothetical protein TNIN_236441 [Trichonephila inaurata madagascariensis]|uniref:Uncharacterized protein n=1 Tax=Trichonephila inaurata madagascariensis TaxID=2747483 RepID=A0A8X6X1C7_9ARAC|nr:hypothetical protein TNIN_236441 [Trichonephila inaurata madagascariensis]
MVLSSISLNDLKSPHWGDPRVTSNPQYCGIFIFINYTSILCPCFDQHQSLLRFSGRELDQRNLPHPSCQDIIRASWGG